MQSSAQLKINTRVSHKHKLQRDTHKKGVRVDKGAGQPTAAYTGFFTLHAAFTQEKREAQVYFLLLFPSLV